MADVQEQQQQLVAAASTSEGSSDASSLSAVPAPGHASDQHASLVAASSDSSGSPAQQQQPKDNKGRWIRIVVASVKAVLFLELAGMVAGLLIASRTGGRRRSGDSDSGSDSDLDPADVLMDYLTGRTSAYMD
jgi:hypothetical protein